MAVGHYGSPTHSPLSSLVVISWGNKMQWQWLKTGLCVSFLVLSWHANAEVPSGVIQESFGRDFGIVTGDQITHEFIVQLPAGYQFSESSLPVPGDLNYWLALNDVAVETINSHPDRQLYRLTFDYQTFYAPLDVRALKIPALSLRAHLNGDKSINITLPDWSFTMSPLKQIAPRGVGTSETSSAFMKATLAPQNAPTQQLQHTVITLGSLVAALTVCWAFLQGWIWRRQQSAFQRAYHQVKQLAAQKETNLSTYSASFQAIHEAFNRVAGKVLFAHQVPEFLVSHPAFCRYEEEINDFFQQSDKLLFREDAAELPDLIVLRRLARRLCHAETMTFRQS